MPENPFNLNNKVIIITGASSGIGRQCAISCSAMGARVMLFGRDAQRLDETLQAMVDVSKHETFAVDLCEYKQTASIVKDISTRIGRISGLINCAGISTTLPINAVSADKMEAFFKTNVLAGINLSKQVVAASNFSQQGGSVIFISSVMGVVGAKGKTLYSMTKGALISATKSLAVELAAKHIRVNAVSPGVVHTPMSKSAIYSRNKEALDVVTKQHPLGLGKPEDVANACMFLLSDASRWITGTNLVVDGGYLAK
ncbi:NAD(P)-dependent dehydrogenase, short-chain alcohol dehydrogenase family [Saccharicrinis carchari]|uniref:NAD(P)-dependent dehydrogenase, short-chain alcohol dehydrogenase family n=1 Tax=Saccharicrinis carchari TaxID=1168039 RepID=A0A521BVC3_SACCC|nr:SDR family oxidoreductase [Saccharicrinis carchari]SMO50561.1 NAD(P)-dependent dehydrogenase, short-chain alcohol dehydrogenase family [Saccharicrinis carchari]